MDFLSGLPEFDHVRPLSYKGSDVVMICFDISRPETLESVSTKVIIIMNTASLLEKKPSTWAIPLELPFVNNRCPQGTKKHNGNLHVTWLFFVGIQTLTSQNKYAII